MRAKMETGLRAGKNRKIKRAVRKIVISAVCSTVMGIAYVAYLEYKKEKALQETEGEKHPTPQDLIYIVAEEFGAEPEDIYCSSVKDPNVVNCRKIVMYLGYRLLNNDGCEKLAHLLNVDRNQFYSDSRTIAHRMVADAQLRDKLERLIKEIRE